MAGWLRGEGYLPRVTEAAIETVEWVRSEPDAVSFVDSGLGRLDGEEAWRVVRRVLGPRPRLVLMAQHRSKELWFEALEAGVGSVLPLPTERPVVLEALRRLAPVGRDS
jgi:DNA-binding NtrC family response regulator